MTAVLAIIALGVLVTAAGCLATLYGSRHDRSSVRASQRYLGALRRMHRKGEP